jgi:uncharacterized protein (TIGR02266 family)
MAYAARQLEHDFGLRAMASMLVRAKINAHTDNNFWMSIEGDVSEGGVFVATHRPVELGMLIILHLRLGASTDVVEAIGSVRWLRPYSRDGGSAPGFGVQFLEVSPRALDRIRRFIGKVRDPILYDD